jgi:hypothetical protein
LFIWTSAEESDGRRRARLVDHSDGVISASGFFAAMVAANRVSRSAYPMKRNRRLIPLLLALLLLVGWAGTYAWRGAQPETFAQRTCIDNVSATSGSTDDDGALEAQVGDCSIENV